VPRTVDHAQRRTHIVDALLRLAQREGLHAVSMRAVAVEADVSLRLVQYYFHSKAQLMHAAIAELERRGHARWRQRLNRRPDTGSTPADVRGYLETFLDEALPSDEESATFHRLWMSYAALAETDHTLPRAPLTDGPRELERLLGAALAAAPLPAGADPDLEAARLLNLVHGLGTGVLAGQRTADEARAVVRYHLDRTLEG